MQIVLNILQIILSIMQHITNIEITHVCIHERCGFADQKVGFYNQNNPWISWKSLSSTLHVCQKNINSGCEIGLLVAISNFPAHVWITWLWFRTSGCKIELLVVKSTNRVLGVVLCASGLFRIGSNRNSDNRFWILVLQWLKSVEIEKIYSKLVKISFVCVTSTR